MTDSLEKVAAEVRRCTLCRLHEGRIRAVPGEGPEEASLFLIGEAPGKEEDRVGRPFVGKAGQVLTKVLNEVGLERSAVFITNSVKCRPPDNRNPKAEEIRVCRGYLLRQLREARSRVIVTLGMYALRSLLGPSLKVADQRGVSLQFEGIPVVATYHPASIRYSRTRRGELVEDLRRALEIAQVRTHASR